jgi:hypothetical protein
MILTDDLCRGSNKDVIVNYFGSFGAVATAAGASAWASGYFQSQRRFSLRATTGRSRPRYQSFALAGDIGVEQDLRRIQDSGLAPKLFTPTTADVALRKALADGQTSEVVPEWQYRIGNTTAAKNHYTQVVSRMGGQLAKKPHPDRVASVHDWLEKARAYASQLVNTGFAEGGATEVVHQRVWLEVFNEWRSYAAQ